MEQHYPVLFEEFALHEGSGGAGQHRGGFGLRYKVKLLRGEARASFVMDHGRDGPLGAIGGQNGGVNEVHIHRNGQSETPEHLSKAQDISLLPGDSVEVRTPGGGGFGPAFERPAKLVARDVARGYYDVAQAKRLFGVVLAPASGDVDEAATNALRHETV